MAECAYVTCENEDVIWNTSTVVTNRKAGVVCCECEARIAIEQKCRMDRQLSTGPSWLLIKMCLPCAEVVRLFSEGWYIGAFWEQLWECDVSLAALDKLSEAARNKLSEMFSLYDDQEAAAEKKFPRPPFPGEVRE